MSTVTGGASRGTPMKVCVTGASGFLGSHLVRLTCDRGHDVHVTCRRPERLGALANRSRRRVPADIDDHQALQRAFAGADVVFHTAGYVGSHPVDWAWKVNAEGPLVAVEAAAAAGCRRVVLTSTISAVGPSPDGQPADERTPYPEDWLGLTYPDSKHEGQ